jgi:hypothetical protein
VLDGLATEVYPIVPLDGDESCKNPQFERIRALADRFGWPDNEGSWVTVLTAVRVLYHEVRNPLVHNLGANTHWRGRPKNFGDAAIVVRTRDWKHPTAEELEKLDEWPRKWPVVFRKPESEGGSPRYVVSVPALYWHTKRLTAALAADDQVLRSAVKLRPKRRVR